MIIYGFSCVCYFVSSIVHLLNTNSYHLYKTATGECYQLGPSNFKIKTKAVAKEKEITKRT